jgi:hypothetical protein
VLIAGAAFVAVIVGFAVIGTQSLFRLPMLLLMGATAANWPADDCRCITEYASCITARLLLPNEHLPAAHRLQLT